jgi:hypothetical protein
MEQAVSPAKLQVWKLMEFVGILPNKKRRVLMEELDKKFTDNELASDEKIILAADHIYPYDKRTRMKFLRHEFKKWERKIQTL